MLSDNAFLRLICGSLTKKMEAITEIDAAPCSLSQMVVSYMRYKCENNELKGIERETFHLHCSARQLQRILNRLESENAVYKTGKGSYRLK